MKKVLTLIVMMTFAGAINAQGLTPVYIDQTDEIGYVNMKGEWVIKFERSEF